MQELFFGGKMFPYLEMGSMLYNIYYVWFPCFHTPVLAGYGRGTEKPDECGSVRGIYTRAGRRVLGGSLCSCHLHVPAWNQLPLLRRSVCRLSCRHVQRRDTISPVCFCLTPSSHGVIYSLTPSRLSAINSLRQVSATVQLRGDQMETVLGVLEVQ